MAVITGKDEQLLIGGRGSRRAAERFDVTNPATGESSAPCRTAREEDVSAAIDAAAAALDGWQVARRDRARRASCAAPPT